jgi:hypothetical protein
MLEISDYSVGPIHCLARLGEVSALLLELLDSPSERSDCVLSSLLVLLHLLVQPHLDLVVLVLLDLVRNPGDLLLVLYDASFAVFDLLEADDVRFHLIDLRLLLGEVRVKIGQPLRGLVVLLEVADK